VLLQGFLLDSVRLAVALIVNLFTALAAGTAAVFQARRPPWTRGRRYLAGTALGLPAISVAMGTETPNDAS
jgi:hypothetical protein